MTITALYFTDENTLGLGKLLQRNGRADVLYPGHPNLPEVPLGTFDLDWMPVVARRDPWSSPGTGGFAPAQPNLLRIGSSASAQFGSELDKTSAHTTNSTCFSPTSFACTAK